MDSKRLNYIQSKTGDFRSAKDMRLFEMKDWFMGNFHYYLSKWSGGNIKKRKTNKCYRWHNRCFNSIYSRWISLFISNRTIFFRGNYYFRFCIIIWCYCRLFPMVISYCRTNKYLCSLFFSN